MFPGEGNSNPLQNSCLENSMNRGAWQATVHGIAKSQTWLIDTFTFWWMRLRGFCKRPSPCGFFVFGHVFFWWVLVFSCPSCSTASWDFGAFAGGDEYTSFYSTILLKFEVIIIFSQVQLNSFSLMVDTCMSCVRSFWLPQVHKVILCFLLEALFYLLCSRLWPISKLFCVYCMW